MKTLNDLLAATDDELMHWLGAELAAIGRSDAFGVIAEVMRRVVLTGRALPKALADIEAVEADARVPAPVKASLASIRAALEDARRR